MKIVIGTANFTRNYGLRKTFVNKKETIKILKHCIKNKIFYIDTAFEYDQFKNLKKHINFKNFKISSKYKFKKKNIKEKKFSFFLKKLIKKNLQDYKITNYENFFIHNFDDLSKSDIKKILLILRQFKEEKLIKFIGISLYDPKSLLKVPNLSHLDIIQVPINIFDRRFVSKNILKTLKKNNVKIQARSIFLQGLLLEDYKKTKKLPFADSNSLNKLNNLIKKKKLNKLNICTSIIKEYPQIHSVVMGVNNLTQFNQNLSSFNKRIYKTNLKNIILTKKNL